LRIQGARASLATSSVPATTGDARSLERLADALRKCFEAPGNSLFNDVERRLVQDAYLYCGSNQMRTAELLGITRNVVRTLLKRHVGGGDVEDTDVEASGDEAEDADEADAPGNKRTRRYDA
jgi:DNA-binding NtrC family response regulator